MSRPLAALGSDIMSRHESLIMPPRCLSAQPSHGDDRDRVILKHIMAWSDS